jgi:hypothetical protein
MQGISSIETALYKSYVFYKLAMEEAAALEILLLLIGDRSKSDSE